jgi:dTDP-4-dehydrorhamnose 3,5-epimerase
LKFTECPLPGAYVVDLEPRPDERGFFARTFCVDEFKEHGLEHEIVQTNLSRNTRAGTLRGMHYQKAPHAETKMVRCVSGAIYDVILDLRPDSPTYGKWHGVELSRANGRLLYVPKGFAHGYQSLTDDSEVLYFVTEFYTPSHEAGVRWNDPAFSIRWPIADPILSPKDADRPDFTP